VDTRQATWVSMRCWLALVGKRGEGYRTALKNTERHFDGTVRVVTSASMKVTQSKCRQRVSISPERSAVER
jgi:hypothetical protein